MGRQRGAGMGGGNDEREQTINQLLSELDGFESNSGVIVLAATNRPDVLDSALLRPGRFDRSIQVDRPDLQVGLLTSPSLLLSCPDLASLFAFLIQRGTNLAWPGDRHVPDHTKRMQGHGRRAMFYDTVTG